MYSIKKNEINRNHKLKSINRGPKKALVISMDYSYWISSKVAVFEYQIQALNSKIEELNSKIEDLTEKVAEKEKNVDKEEKPKKKRGMTGFLLFSKEKRPEVKEELGDVKPTEVVTEVAKRWKALTDEERATWNERAKEGQEVEVE